MRKGKAQQSGARGVAIGIGLAWALAAAACHDTSYQGVDDNCLIEQRCQCRVNTDCAEGAICIDGQCKVIATDTVDTHQPDTSTPDTDTSEDIEVVEGGFLWPCTTNAECNSGRCIALSATENVCTIGCREDCPLDWNCRGLAGQAGIEFVCVPSRERLCEPCVTDEACPGEGAACVKLDGETACGRDCSQGQSCPDGYICGDAESISGQSVRQCVPSSGVCQCRPATAGSEIPCTLENEIGTCYGTRICQNDGSLGACSARVPSVEVCNGLDDDCNGFPDDRIEPTACTRANAFGTCVGEKLCLPVLGEVCTASEPSTETCDNLDNDCDGATDEDFKDANGRLTQIEHCGACGNSCVGRIPHATARCDASTETPSCAVAVCDPGYIQTSPTTCSRPPALLCAPCSPGASCGGPDDLCVVLDDDDPRTFCGRDCSADSIHGAACPEGYTCRESDSQCVPSSGTCDCSEDNAGQVRPCSRQNAFGTCFGIARCEGETGWSACSAAVAVAEVCNGLDDDCDGIADDGLGGAACVKTNAFGSCPGRQVCDGAAGSLICVGEDAKAEVCNGIDDDCDGETDEGFAINIRDGGGAVVGLKYSLTNQHCGGCNIACTPVSPATEVQCDGSGEVPFCAVVACQPGYFAADGRVCLPVPTNNLCLACESDADCQGPNDQCLFLGDGGTCGRDCSVGSIYSTSGATCTGMAGERGCCPAGFTCDGAQCIPESGDCGCTVTGALRSCVNENPFGRCVGVETCTATGVGAGWSTCSARSPAPEVCNGVDDDCDGLVDGSDPSIDTSDLVGYPDCENVSSACSGRWVCGGSAGWLCTAREPEVEVCNGRDDNCDGVIDDGFTDPDGSFTNVENCGQCGLDCRVALTNLSPSPDTPSVECRVVEGAPVCVPLACAPGFIPYPLGPGVTPRVCLPLAAASCRPCTTDSECGLGGDRCLEVAPGEGTFCAQPCGASSPYAGCTGAIGQQGCCATGYLCNNVGGEALCMPASGSCQCSPDRAGNVRGCQATGNGGATTCFGLETCTVSGTSSTWSTCDLSGNVEVCDSIDNDCDGLTDEGFTVNGRYVSNENCGACGRNCTLAYSTATLHAFGVCDGQAQDGPRCALGGCTSTVEAAGVECRSNADCTSGSCDPDRHVCRRTCANTAQCGAGFACVEGNCRTSCTTNAQCASLGPQATCVNNTCATTFQWVNLDGADGNGCECAVATGRGPDRPDVLGVAAVPGAVYLDTDCDGIDGDMATAIFVREGEAGDGSYDHPFGSIQDAIQSLNTSSAATASATPILVAGGLYEEAIRLVNGAVIHGGYAPDFLARDIVLFPTLIAAHATDLAAGDPGTVTAIGIDQPTELVGFTILGWDAVAPGSASYALYVRDSTSALRVSHGAILGGRGGAGTSGNNGASGNGGGNGQNGVNARECANANCTSGAETQVGGSGGTNASCAAAVGCVGMEADTNEETQVKDPAVAGCTYSRGGDRGQYNGAGAEYCKYDFNPIGNQVGGDGTDGTRGNDGGGGGGCSDTDGSLSGGLWTGGGATIGAVGQAGTGGNGGSAGGWVSNLKTASCTIPGLGLNRGDVGGSGGGGGAGGCGGGAGLPGGSGGASFAVFVSPRGGSAPVIAHNTIIRGLGGRGGNGGNGGTGGRGGNGGRGGLAFWPAWGAGIGGTGGRGGDGGNAGGGGGGCGGPSYGIAGPSIPVSYGTSNTFAIGDATLTSGPGGAGGLSAGSGQASAGARGESRNVKAY